MSVLLAYRTGSGSRRSGSIGTPAATSAIQVPTSTLVEGHYYSLKNSTGFMDRWNVTAPVRNGAHYYTGYGGFKSEESLYPYLQNRSLGHIV